MLAEELKHLLFPQRPAEDVGQVHRTVGGEPLGVRAARRPVPARQLRLLPLGDDGMRVLVEQEVGVDAVDDDGERALGTLCRGGIASVILLPNLHVGRPAQVAKTLDLLVLDRAAERKAREELVEVDRLVAERRAHLARDEGALALDPREVAVHRRQEEARDVGRGRHFEVLGHIAVRELVAEDVHPEGRASPILLRLVAEALRRLLARVPKPVLGARHLRRVLLAHDLELLAEGGVALLLDEGDLGVLVDHLAHLGQLVAARLLQDVLGEHVLKAARHRGVGLNLLPNLAQVEVAELGVLARKGEEHEALKELVQLEALVAALGALAFLDTRVALGRDEGRVHLVGAHEDQVDPRHGEGIGRELAVERQVGQLRRLHRHRRLGRAGAGRARFGIL